MMRLPPLCPAGHLPLKGGDWINGTRGLSFSMPLLDDLLRQSIVPGQSIAERDLLIGHEVPISPLEGEMSRSDRGGCPDTIANPNLPLIRLPASSPRKRGEGRSQQRLRFPLPARGKRAKVRGNSQGVSA
ncbi:MAG: hypothetical protein CTR54_19420 [Rhizobium sp.]|nr:MAG: hypothetical protein CTR54_19420 [Rhizobium sp.]